MKRKFFPFYSEEYLNKMKTNEITLTKDQLIQIAVNAVNASIPVGMGMMYFRDIEYTPEDLCNILVPNSDLYIDYYDGRMVKLDLRQGDTPGKYIIPESAPHPEYQSWVKKYSSYQELIDSVLK